MSKDNWSDSRDRLLEDIDKFSRLETPGAGGTTPPPAPPQRSSPAAPQPAAAAPQAAAKAAPVATDSPATPPPPAALHLTRSQAMQSKPPQGVASSLLDSLKQQAQAKQQSENQKSSQREEILLRIHSALGMAYQYFNALVEQLNILKPPYAKVYSFFGVADFEGMAWQEGRTDFRMQETASDNRLYDQVTLRYRLASQKQFRVVRENPALEKLRKALFDYNIAFSVDEVRNERGHTERATFTFPCEIKAGLLLSGNYETGNLLLRTRHIERFGLMEYQLQPESINQDSLDQLAHLILGESNRVSQLFQRTV